MAEPMDWLNQPPEWRDEDGVLTIVTGEPHRLLARTHYGFVRDDGHSRLTPAPGDFSATVAFRGDYETLYDQAGLMLRIDGENWIKAGVEFVGGRRMLSVVVTRDFSDWSTTPAPTEAQWLLLRLTRMAAPCTSLGGRGPSPSACCASPTSPRDRPRSGRWPARRSAPASAPPSATSASARRKRPRRAERSVARGVGRA